MSASLFCQDPVLGLCKLDMWLPHKGWLIPLCNRTFGLEPWEDFILVCPAQGLGDSGPSDILLDWEDLLCVEWLPLLLLESVDDIL